MRFAHTSITVKDLDQSLEFYTQALGLAFERRREIPENRAEIAFVLDPGTGARLELTHWKGRDHYEEGDQLDHLAFEVPDLSSTLAHLRSLKVPVVKEPFTLSGGSRRIAFVTDPNGIWIELLETAKEARGR
jgi:lactoylglutathione lyase